MASMVAVPQTSVRSSDPAGVAGSGWRRPSVIAAGCGVVLLAVAGFLATALAGSDSAAASAVNNLGQLTSAAGAALGAAVAARRQIGTSRRVWLLVAFACTCWTVGQLIWCYVELVRDQDMPQVSIADPFFLSFTALMAVAVWSSGGRRPDRLSTLVDGFIIGMSLFAISWATSIHRVITEATVADIGVPGLLINLAYPCGDVVVLTVVLLDISRGVRHRSSTVAVAAGMGLIAVSDGFYAYLSATATFDSGSVSSLGWIAGFGLIGCAALASRPAPQPAAPVVSSFRAVRSDPREERAKARSADLVPYVSLAAALIIVVINRYSTGTDRVTDILVIITFIAVLVRQYLTIRDNVTLTRYLEARERELEHQALADPLTGLPNRVLFTDRVAHALEQHRRTRRPLALLFIDLDDFKAVNDTLGHPVGDELVIRAAERFRGAIRASDTVARFGGDEFAVLVEGDSDAVDAGSRLVECMAPAFTVGGHQLTIGASIGLAEVTAAADTPTLDDLFARADIAMYAAKRGGKSRLARYEPSMTRAGRPA